MQQRKHLLQINYHISNAFCGKTISSFMLENNRLGKYKQLTKTERNAQSPKEERHDARTWLAPPSYASITPHENQHSDRISYSVRIQIMRLFCYLNSLT